MSGGGGQRDSGLRQSGFDRCVVALGKRRQGQAQVTAHHPHPLQGPLDRNRIGFKEQ